jgi:molybdopterin-guanine dinucleotide biosynthesis protein A
MMDAFVIAGGVSQPGEPLYPYTAGSIKALLDISGKPMIQWVLDALEHAKLIDRVIIVGMQPQADLHCAKLWGYLPDHGSILENIRAGVKKVCELNPTAEFVAVVSSDIPTICPEHVDWVVQSALQIYDGDIFYNVITREVMEKRFPGSNRSFISLQDMDVCGGDLNIVRTSAVSGNDDVWIKIIEARKNALKQAALIGFDTLFLLLLHRLTLKSAVARISRRIKLVGQALVCPYAEIGMDVDKPHQLAIVRADISGLSKS